MSAQPEPAFVDGQRIHGGPQMIQVFVITIVVTRQQTICIPIQNIIVVYTKLVMIIIAISHYHTVAWE